MIRFIARLNVSLSPSIGIHKTSNQLYLPTVHRVLTLPKALFTEISLHIKSCIVSQNSIAVQWCYLSTHTVRGTQTSISTVLNKESLGMFHSSEKSIF